MDASYDRCMYCRGECSARAVGTCDRYGKKKCAYKDGRGTSVDRKCDGRNGGSDNGNDCFD